MRRSVSDGGNVDGKVSIDGEVSRVGEGNVDGTNQFGW